MWQTIEYRGFIISYNIYRRKEWTVDFGDSDDAWFDTLADAQQAINEFYEEA